jgi:hypothetical protein
MKKKYHILIFLIIFISCLFLTWPRNRSFYEKGSGWDYLRFPLLEPYYAIQISEKYGWTIPLEAVTSDKNFRHYLEILNVSKVAVEEDKILVYSTFSKPIETNEGEAKELHWFILIPGKSEFGFSSEEEFIQKLQDLGIFKPNWQEPLFLLQKFDQTGCLDWIPDCTYNPFRLMFF